MASKAEGLFAAEAALRAAAVSYAEWSRANNRTPAIMNHKRRELRSAARAYSQIATELDE